MVTRSESIRQLANVIHTMRPEWDAGGIRAILEDDSRPMLELIDVAMAVAHDMTARTPAVIRAKDTPVPGIDPRAGVSGMATPPSIREILTGPKQDPALADWGSGMARDAIKAAARECAANREAVLAYPDLAELLTFRPCGYAKPEHWNGYVPTEPGPVRTALVALIATANRRLEVDQW
jgi:hypothetical protein